MQEETKTKTTLQENEIDLGVFFNLLGRIVKKIVALFTSFFLAIYNLVLFVLIFIKRRIIWLALGSLIGLGLGLWQYFDKGPSYYSDMIVRSNFESSRLLYNQIDYYNSLIKQHRTKDLSAIFHISEANANRLISFSITPVDDNIEAVKLYDNTFLSLPNSRQMKINGTDTQWVRTIGFQDFKNNLQPYDFPLQKIRLYSSSPDVYSNVEKGIVMAISNNQTLQAIKQTTTGVFKAEENILERSLSSVDTLRQAYSKRIERSTSAQSEGNNVFVTDKAFTSPEVELFETELVLKDELLNAKRRNIDQQDILQVYAGFNPTGTKSSGLDQDFSKYTLWAFLITLGLLLLIEFYKQLDRIDKSRKEVPPHYKRLL